MLAVLDSLILEQYRRFQRIREFTLQALHEPDDMRALAGRVRDMFDVEVATILLEEPGELHLAASTDPKLGEGTPVVYRNGQGLTGWVFAHNKPLRLQSAHDVAEIKAATGIERAGPLHPERDRDGQVTVRFLGVPMRAGTRPIGVVRLSRRASAPPFDRDEELDLQFVADLLATSLDHHWEIQLLENILDSTRFACAVSRWERGSDGRVNLPIVRANPGAQALLGHTEESLRGLDARELYVAEDRPRLESGLTQAKRALSDGQRPEFGPTKTQLVRRDGSRLPVEASFRLLRNPLVRPRTTYVIGLARDISDTERLSDLLEAMDFAYFRADQRGRTLDPRAADSRITGYSAQELAHMSRARLFERETERDELHANARLLGLVKDDLRRFKRKDGKRVWVQGYLRILRDGAGTEIGVEGVYHDVTDRIQLQQFLDEPAARALSDAELWRGAKATAEQQLDYQLSLGHQLLTPLGSLIENLRNIEQGVVAGSLAEERLGYVIGQAVVCTRLVRNLSYMDKILRGEDFPFEDVPLHRLAIETKLDFLHLLKEKRLQLAIDKAGLERHAFVRGHREMLRQVLVNLVDNAIKYSVPGSTIIVRGVAERTLEISSHGLRVPAASRSRIFERGFRTGSAKAVVPHGTGVGLWLVRKILDAHGATIECDEEQRGETRTVFRVRFAEASQARRKP